MEPLYYIILFGLVYIMSCVLFYIRRNHYYLVIFSAWFFALSVYTFIDKDYSFPIESDILPDEFIYIDHRNGHIEGREVIHVWLIDKKDDEIRTYAISATKQRKMTLDMAKKKKARGLAVIGTSDKQRDGIMLDDSKTKIIIPQLSDTFKKED
jgi:hypothetical protein